MKYKLVSKAQGEVNMEINRRLFKIDDEWCVVHIPKQPNGFLIFVLGDTNHYVNKHSSLWLQNYQRFELIETLRNNGYTVAYSNLYGANWGNQDAIHLLNRLYHLIIKEQILNEKFHIFAEGAGSITAFRWLAQMKEKVRSLALLNPCIDVGAHIKREKENKLFYKRLIKDLSQAYSLQENEIEERQEELFHLESMEAANPIKIWHTTNMSRYNMMDHSRKLERLREEKGLPFYLSLLIYEKRFQIANSICRFYKMYEKTL